MWSAAPLVSSRRVAADTVVTLTSRSYTSPRGHPRSLTRDIPDRRQAEQVSGAVRAPRAGGVGPRPPYRMLVNYERDS